MNRSDLDDMPCGNCAMGIYDQRALDEAAAYFRVNTEVPDCVCEPGRKCQGCLDYLNFKKKQNG